MIILKCITQKERNTNLHFRETLNKRNNDQEKASIENSFHFTL